ncbi:chaperonin 10-like protein [Geopyxis carbonaria]|nr:chaperonin 10-like protein [Geopyxis carbonaria]
MAAHVYDKNLSLVVTKDHTIHLEEQPVPQPGPNDALLRMKANGICGSDIHFWKTGAIGELKVLGNCVLGHEGAGEVIAVGADVKNVAVGDRVAVEPLQPCRACPPCKTGDTNLCTSVVFTGVYPHAGSIRRYHSHPAYLLHKLPSNMSYTSGALLEPLSVALNALENVTVTLGEPVLVCGAGPIGLANLLCARASGAAPIVLTDVAAPRLEFARQRWPWVRTHLVDPALAPQETAAAVVKLLDGVKPAVALECTGVESSVAVAVYAVRPKGTVMVVGVGKDVVAVPFMHASMWEIRLKWSQRYKGTWERGIRAVQDGVVDGRELEGIVTHRFGIGEAVEAMRVASDPRSGGVKVQVCDESEM